MEDSQEKSKFLHKFIPIPGDDFDEKKKGRKNDKVAKISLLMGVLLLIGWMTWITITTQSKPEQERVLESIIGDLIQRNHDNNTSPATLDDVRAKRDLTTIFVIVDIVQKAMTVVSYGCQIGLLVHKDVARNGRTVPAIPLITRGTTYKNFKDEIDDAKATTNSTREEILVLKKDIKKANDRMTKAHQRLKYSITNINSVVDTVDNVMKKLKKFDGQVDENTAMAPEVNQSVLDHGMLDSRAAEVTGMDLVIKGIRLTFELADAFARWNNWYHAIARQILKLKKSLGLFEQYSLTADNIADSAVLIVDLIKVIDCIFDHTDVYTNKKEERDRAVETKNKALQAKKHLETVLQGVKDSTTIMVTETERLVDYTNELLTSFNSPCKTTLGSIHSDLSEINDYWQIIKVDLDLANTADIMSEAFNQDGKQKLAVETMKSLFANVDEDRVIESLQSAGLKLPDELWTDWEREQGEGCSCEESNICTEAWSRTCKTMSCIGPEVKNVDICKAQKDSLVFFKTCKSRDQINSGICKTLEDKTILDGPVDGRYVAANVLQGECYRTCKGMPGATGCQFSHGDCFAFFESLASEEVITDNMESCYVFKNVQGSATDSILKVLLDRLEGEENFSETTLDAWTLQMLRIDPDLVESQENGWKKMISYQNSARDEWGLNPSSYRERNEIVLESLTGATPAGLRIFEPCNFASNFAYYNLMYKTNSLVWMPEDDKKALGQASAGLALGSSFFHGSHTNLGQALDNMMIKIIAFILYETYINALHLPYQTPNIIMSLKSVGRERTGVQMAQVITDMYRNEPVEIWNQTLQTIDVPKYEITFGALIMTMSAHAKESLLRSWTNTILLQILPVEDSDKDFLKQFEPKIKRALQDRTHFNIEEPDVFNQMTAGLKLMLAFVFQETVDPLNSLRHVLTSLPIRLPSINKFLNDFGTLGSNEGTPGTTEAYPGEERCGHSSSHAVWHTQSATGLADLFKLVDELVRKQKERQDKMNGTPR